MTYDFSIAQLRRPGPNSPASWVKANAKYYIENGKIEPSMLLMGTNFYGYEFTAAGMHALTGRDFTTKMAQNALYEIVWQSGAQEHIAVARGGSEAVFFPTPQSLSVRLKMMETLGVGLSIWELGQGHEWFFDVL